MSNKLIVKDLNGNKVDVVEARYDSLGDIDSLYIRDEQSRGKWVHARDYEIVSDPGQKVEGADDEQKVVKTKDTQLKTEGDGVVKK